MSTKEYLFAKIGGDTAENETPKVCQKLEPELEKTVPTLTGLSSVRLIL